MKRVEVELTVKMIVDVKKNHDLSNIKNEMIITDVDIDENINILLLKIVDSKIKEIF